MSKKLKQLELIDLKKTLHKTRDEISAKMIKFSSGETNLIKDIKTARKKIAQVLTEINSRRSIDAKRK